MATATRARRATIGSILQRESRGNPRLRSTGAKCGPDGKSSPALRLVDSNRCLGIGPQGLPNRENRYNRHKLPLAMELLALLALEADVDFAVDVFPLLGGAEGSEHVVEGARVGRGEIKQRDEVERLDSR